MNYIRVQQNLLKMADARDGWKHKSCNLPWFETNDRIWAVPDGIMCVGILKSQFYLDKDKIFKNVQPWSKGEQMIKYGQDADEAIDMHTIINAVIENKKYVLHKFVTKDEPIYVSENLLKDFELHLSHFTGTNTKTPLYVWEGDEIVGTVFPVNYKGGE